MAADKEAILIVTCPYSKCNPLLRDIFYSVLEHIYTTIAALYAKIRPQNRTNFYPYGLNSAPMMMSWSFAS